MKKPISFITPFTTLDYPNHLACIVWFSGCNMRCEYCYNSQIVLENGTLSVDELITFLKKRQNLLDAVVLSGGECTLFKDLLSLCKKIKSLGFKIKIDTNGSNPTLLQTLIEKKLVDFVALDFKALSKKFTTLTHSNLFENFKFTLELLIQKDFNFEVRTTIHSDLLSEDDINEMIDFLHVKNYKNTYYLQNFLHVETLGNLSEPEKSFDKDKLSDILKVEFRNF